MVTNYLSYYFFIFFEILNNFVYYFLTLLPFIVTKIFIH